MAGDEVPDIAAFAVSARTLIDGVVNESLPSVGSVYFAVTVSPGFTYILPLPVVESPGRIDSVSPPMSNTPVFFPVSVSVRISVSPVVQFVIVTVTVSVTVPFRFWSVSVMAGATESPILRTVGNTPEDTVDVNWNCPVEVVAESLASVGSTYFALNVSADRTYSFPVLPVESDAFVLVGSPARPKIPVFLPVSVSVTTSVSPVVQFVTVTVTVSTAFPSRFWSLSVTVTYTESPVLTGEDAVLDELAVSGTTPIDGVVNESLPSVGSVYFAVTVSPGFTYSLPLTLVESPGRIDSVSPPMSKMPVFFPVSVSVSTSVSPVTPLVIVIVIVSTASPFRF